MRTGFTSHPLYTIWCNIKRRCYVSNAPFYRLYGAKGVRMCEEWRISFKSFHEWCLSNGWERGLQIDKDLLSKEKPGKLYSPETCSIVTRTVNTRNKSTTQFITYQGKTLSVQEWGEKLNISYKLMWQRLNEGWTIERMVKEPGLVEHNCILTYRGESLRMTEWSKRLNINLNTLGKRIRKGWSVERSFETPIDKKYSHSKKQAA